MKDALREKLSIVGEKTTCTGIAIIKDGKMLIGLRNYTPDKWKKVSVWTTPGGRCDAGETIEQGLRRETVEETGIKSLVVNDFLGEVPGAMPGDTLFFFIGTTDEEPRLMEPEKFSEWKWCGLSEMPENFINHAALALAKEYSKFHF